MREVEDFSQSEFDEIYNGLKCCAIKEANAVDFPKAIILGGQPGAGKSSLITQLCVRQNKNVVVISGDDLEKNIPVSTSYMLNTVMIMWIIHRSFRRR